MKPMMLVATALFTLAIICKPASAKGPLHIRQTECLSYYTIVLPDYFEYALMPPDRMEHIPRSMSELLSGWGFESGLGVWQSRINLSLLGIGDAPLIIGPISEWKDISSIMDYTNDEQQRKIDSILDRLSRINAGDVEMIKLMKSNVSEIHLFEPVPKRDAIARISGKDLLIHALVNDRYLAAEISNPELTTQQALDSFVAHLKPRELGKILPGEGSCVPFGFVTGESAPADIGMSIRLKNRPDIVLYLNAWNASSGNVADALTYLKNETRRPIRLFYQALDTRPMHRLREFETITLDGHKGMATFVEVKRDARIPDPYKLDNPDTDGVDWGFLAYAPGVTGGKPGESFNVVLRVERFGRFAKQPMTEHEFREMALGIAASIKRRPGAWTVH